MHLSRASLQQRAQVLANGIGLKRCVQALSKVSNLDSTKVTLSGELELPRQSESPRPEAPAMRSPRARDAKDSAALTRSSSSPLLHSTLAF